MEYITDLTNFQMDTSSIVSLGKFDGLHRGHQKLLTKNERMVHRWGKDGGVYLFGPSAGSPVGKRPVGSDNQ